MGRRRMGAALALGLAAAAGGCASADRWDAATAECVGPVDKAIHGDMKRAWLSDDVAKVHAFYDVPADHPALRHRAEMMSRFTDVERAVVSLRPPVAFDDPAQDHVTVFVRTILHGKSPLGPLAVIDDCTMVVRHDDPSAPKIVEETPLGTRWVEPQGKGGFTDVTVPAGITMVADSVGYELRSIVIPDIPFWYGAACGDYDGDGLDDLYLLNGGADRLYRNVGGGRFEDVTERAGLANTGSIGQSALFGDFDNDGHPDLLVVNLLDSNQMFRNRGDGTFEEVTDRVGFPASRYNTSCALLDYDRDGLLDVFLVGGGDFVDDTPKPVYEAENGTPDRLLRNLGGFRFEDVTERAGVGGTQWGLAVACTDYDRDGDTDIYVANDFGLNSLYRNNGDGTFSDVAADAEATVRGPGMGCTFGDYDNDGHMDLFVSNMFSNSEWLLQHPDYPLPASALEVLLFKPFIYEILHEMTRGSALLRNRGDGTFEDLSDTMSDVRDAPQWAWGCAFLDYDNDADLDVYVANGMITGEQGLDL